MLIRTHLVITLFFVILFLSKVESKLSFVLIAVIATIIPDIDSPFSKIGKRKTLKVLQFFTKHRGMIHSFTFLFLIVLFFALFFPVIALPFFLGYSLHLIADSFTIKGIKPFYPLKRRIFGKIRTGGRVETIIFVIFLIADLVLILLRFF